MAQVNYDADKAYIFAQLQALTNGFGQSYPTLADLNSAHPTNDNKNHIIQEDGNWYFWMDGFGWTSGGQFQSVQLANGSVHPITTSFFKEVLNFYDYETATDGYDIEQNGTLHPDQYFSLSGYIPVLGNTEYVCNAFANVVFFTNNQQSSYIDQPKTIAIAGAPFTTPANAKYLRLSIMIDKSDFMLSFFSSAITQYEPYNKAYFNNDYLRNIDGEKLNEGSVPYSKMSFVDVKVLYDNQAGKFSNHKAPDFDPAFTRTANPDGSLTISGTPIIDTWAYFRYYPSTSFKWKNGHSYFVAAKVSLDEASAAQLSNGSLTLSVFEPRNGVNNPLGTKINHNNIISIGSATDIIAQFDINVDDQSGSHNIFIQAVKALAGNPFSLTLKGVAVLDMGETANPSMTYGNAYSLFTQYGYQSKITEGSLNIKAGDTLMGDIKNLIGYESKIIFDNLIGVFDNSRVWGSLSAVEKTVNEDGSVTLTLSPTDVDTWLYFYYTMPTKWLNGHSYFASLKMSLDAGTQFGDTEGNMAVSLFQPRFSNNQIGETTAKNNIITVGNTADIIRQFDVSTELDTSSPVVDNTIFFQAEKVPVGDTLAITIKDILILDMGETANPDLTYDEAYGDFINFGYIQEVVEESTDLKAKTAGQADVALIAKSVENAPGSSEIEFWGDSLVAQGYAQNVADITGRICTTHGYGGKKSTYIRDEFLANANFDHSMIINVGRNNYSTTERIIADIRIMVSALNHTRFIICCPPNGAYSGEFIGQSNYHYFTDLEDRLVKEYPNNFVNTRLASIFDYDMGNVTLDASFTQPNVGVNVQITVSDTSFLTTYNAADVTYFGSDLMNRIRIGESFDKMDLYDVVSVDSPTQMTVKLNTSNNIAPGGAVSNPVDDGGTNAICYLKVIQEGDYQCFAGGITLSTFRQDNVHMSLYGRDSLAKILARAIYAKNL